MAAKDIDDAQKDEDQTEAAGPMLDISQTAVKKMIATAKAKGYITYDELNKALPQDQVSSEQIEDVMAMLSELGVNVVEEEEGEADDPDKPEESKEIATTSSSSETLDRTDDPVRMYLREMGSVELLSREGEIAIAKRIEAGRSTMISGLCESPLTFQAITIWRDELLEEKIMLRDVIDLETTFGQALVDDAEDEEVIEAAAAPEAKDDEKPAVEPEGGEEAKAK
ncbi:MAG: RNA polymerase primary sigma factor, partial [Paracoccaceae bacterium]